MQLMPKASVYLALMLFLCSCATYNMQISQYYNQLSNNQYESALKQIDHIRILKKKRNQLLNWMEKGKLLHLMGNYDSSNYYLNLADNFIEDNKYKSAQDVFLTATINPMITTYRGEDFEKFMLHYYKALNYCYTNKLSDALVEARRITLTQNNQQEKLSEKKYYADAFSLILQGMIYEKANDWNNAFISYRNATDVFLKSNNAYYGVAMPKQLEFDLLLAAYKVGFIDEFYRYNKLFNNKYTEADFKQVSGKQAIIFWENGFAPIKEEQNFFFSLIKDNGAYFLVDNTGTYRFPFDVRVYVDANKVSLSDLQTFRVAFPIYRERLPKYQTLFISNDSTYTSVKAFEKVQDINVLAFETLRQRSGKEILQALTRLVTKKLAELAAKPQKKDDKDKELKEGISTGIQILNFFTEKADTRNWQSLPHDISYKRVDLTDTTNVFYLKHISKWGEGTKSTITLPLAKQANSNLMIYNLVDLK